MLQGHVVETCCSDSFPCVIIPHFCEKIMLWGQNFVPATCCIKFSRFEFVHYVEGTKWPQCSLSFSVHCSSKLSLLQNRHELERAFHIKSYFPGTLSDFCDFYASICFLCTGLRTVPATCTSAVHTKGLVPATSPCNMSPSVCRPLK